MKTFPFIVINKNNMKQLNHFATADQVAIHLLGKKVENILVIVKECKIVPLSEIGSADVNKIERVLNEVANALH